MIQNKPLLLRALAGALICIPVYASAGNASYYNTSTEAKVFPVEEEQEKKKQLKKSVKPILKRLPPRATWFLVACLMYMPRMANIISKSPCHCFSATCWL